MISAFSFSRYLRLASICLPDSFKDHTFRVLCVASTILLFFSPLYLLLCGFNRGSLMFVLVLQFALTISLVILQRDQELSSAVGFILGKMKTRYPCRT